MLGILPRRDWGAAKLHTSGTLSKDRSGQAPLRVVSALPVLTDIARLRIILVEAGPRVKKTHLYEEMLEHATPSEEAVCLSLDPLALDIIVIHLSPGQIR